MKNNLKCRKEMRYRVVMTKNYTEQMQYTQIANYLPIFLLRTNEDVGYMRGRL